MTGCPAELGFHRTAGEICQRRRLRPTRTDGSLSREIPSQSWFSLRAPTRAGPASGRLRKQGITWAAQRVQEAVVVLGEFREIQGARQLWCRSAASMQCRSRSGRPSASSTSFCGDADRRTCHLQGRRAQGAGTTDLRVGAVRPLVAIRDRPRVVHVGATARARSTWRSRESGNILRTMRHASDTPQIHYGAAMGLSRFLSRETADRKA